MTGCGRSARRSTVSDWKLGRGGRSPFAISARSWPAEKHRPAPRTTTSPMRSVSFAIASICARKSMNISTLIELSLSGRLSVSVASPSLSSRSTRPAMFLPPIDAMVGADVSTDSLLQWKIGHGTCCRGALVGKEKISQPHDGAEGPAPYFISESSDFILYHGDALELLPRVAQASVDLIF